MNRISFLLIFSLLISVSGYSQKDFNQYVNPFVGTGGHGHTYPGAVYPFGMMQLSPDTRLTGWDGCSGYHYSDSVLYGFSHTHLSGTGVSDYGDLLIKPFADASLDIDEYITDKKFSSEFSHKGEHASPGYYSVYLPNDAINVNLTTTARCGMHQYTFNPENHNKVLLDLEHRDQVIYSKLQFVNDSEIVGVRYSKAWAQNQKFYFVLRLSEPIQHKFLYVNDTLMNGPNFAIGTDVKAILYVPQGLENLTIKVGISATGIEGARKNLEAEMPGWDFNEYKSATEEAWNKELGKIDYTHPSQEKMRIFYTSLYHTMIVPNLFMDVDSMYLGRDFEVHKSEKGDYYTVFSLWDTYRAYHPLMTLIDRKRTLDFIYTFEKQYKEGGLLPVWEFASNETFCMIGYHSVPVIADAIAKGIVPDRETMDIMLEAMIHSSTRPHHGLDALMEYGYISSDQESESVSKTLEYAYDDWCIAQTAAILGDEEVFNTYIDRAQAFKNIYDPETGFFRPKANGAFVKPFDPREVNFNFTEANAWQYTFYVPQDVQGYINLLGGDAQFIEKLDSLFMGCSKTTGRNQADITGLIGQYAHGNEPSHHMAYLYAYAGQPWRTQDYCHQILNNMYADAPDGLSGNEDCGQMSAWYVLSSLGLYPVNPADGYFVFGSPQLQRATINLENGNKFTISCTNYGENNKYIASVMLNGSEYPYSYIHYDDIFKGGNLVFTMSDKPNREFASTQGYRPVSAISNNQIIPVPYFEFDKQTFNKKTKLEIHKNFDGALQYKICENGEWKFYKKPLKIKESSIVFARIHFTDELVGPETSCKLIKIDQDLKVQLLSEYNSQYTAGGSHGLVDYQRGGSDFRTGGWQGYLGTDFGAIVDLGKKKTISKITLSALQEARSWIWLPTYVEFYYSVDGETFTSLGKLEHDVSDRILDAKLYEFVMEFDAVEARYIKVFGKNYGIIPDWHLGAGNRSWIFVDEIIIE
ncbi:MAG: glycosyl hydrolase family 92 [Marinilabiliales bacterium]|nr:MAG: glycosyl hydrolase family 92 [Marinilabiliales bacterium]